MELIPKSPSEVMSAGPIKLACLDRYGFYVGVCGDCCDVVVVSICLHISLTDRGYEPAV